MLLQWNNYHKRDKKAEATRRWSQRWEGGGHQPRASWSTQTWKGQEGPSPGASGGYTALGPLGLRPLLSMLGEDGYCGFNPYDFCGHLLIPPQKTKFQSKDYKSQVLL